MTTLFHTSPRGSAAASRAWRGAAILSRGDQRAEDDKERGVDRRGGRPANCGRGKDGDAAGRPQSGKGCERNARDRQAAGPVRDRRQQEARDDGAAVAEDHFMDASVRSFSPRASGRSSAWRCGRLRRNHLGSPSLARAALQARTWPSAPRHSSVSASSCSAPFKAIRSRLPPTKPVVPKSGATSMSPARRRRSYILPPQTQPLRPRNAAGVAGSCEKRHQNGSSLRYSAFEANGENQGGPIARVGPASARR